MYDDSLELCIIQGKGEKGDDPIKMELVPQLEATKFMVRKRQFEEIARGAE